MANYRKGSHTKYDIKIHIVWVTKYRKPVMHGEMSKRLRMLIREICLANEVQVVKGHISKDHVHLLLSYPPKLSISKLAQYLKGKTSRKLLQEYSSMRKQFWGSHIWARGYFAVSTGNVTDKVIKRNILSRRTTNQKTLTLGFMMNLNRLSAVTQIYLLLAGSSLIYPSYGDTYPTFNGAIGMTYEQGGSGRAVETENGEILTLKDRMDHHTTSALSTIEITSANSEAVIENFIKFYSNSRLNPPGKYKSYVVKRSNDLNGIREFTQLLDKQKIIYGKAKRPETQNGFAYRSKKDVNLKIDKDDLIIPVDQAKAVLTQVLMDPDSQLEDSLTYDITAWSLPYAYDLEAYAVTQNIEIGADFELSMAASKRIDDAYAYFIRQQGHKSEQFIGKLLMQDITIKRINEATDTGNEIFEPGSYLITKADNRSNGRLKEVLETALEDIELEVISVQTGLVANGPDLGSNNHSLLEHPEILCFRGDGVSANSFGQVKYYFERILQFPITVVDVDRFGRIDMNKYNTLIMPNGRYDLSTSSIEKLEKWIEEGGKVISIGNATRLFADRDGYSLTNYIDEESKSNAEEEDRIFELAARYHHYSDLERESIASYIPGAIVSLKMDHTHPLAFGVGNQYHSLKTNSLAYPLMLDAENVGFINGEVDYIGFMGHRAKKKLKDTVSFAVEEKGSGNIIYLIDDPLFRCFWYKGFRIFSNAVFF